MIIQSAKDISFTPSRIISLVPSQTELLHFLGLENVTVGITKFCVHPAEWRISKTIIGGTKNVHIEKVKSLQPDLIIANKEENVKQQVEALAQDCPVCLTDVNNLADALQMILDIGSLTNTYDKAQNLTKKISDDFSTISLHESAIPAAYLIWQNPYMTIGGDTFIHDMMSRCGLENIFADRKRYPEISIDEIKDSECRLLLLSTEPYPFNQTHIIELELLLPGIKIVLADGEIFSWYGSRLLYAPGYLNKLFNQIGLFL